MGLGRIELAVILLIFLGFAWRLSSLQMDLAKCQQSDTAMFLDVADAVARKGVPHTKTNAAIMDAYPLWGMDGDAALATRIEPSPQPINQFTRHPYLIAYVLAPAAWLFPMEKSLPAVHACALAGMLLLIYLFLRRWGISWWFSAVFTATVALHPAWSLAATGQLYFDRFYLPTALAFTCLLYELVTALQPATWRRIGLTTLFGLLAASTNERGAGMVMCIALGCLGLWFRRGFDRRLYLVFASLAVILGTYVVLWFKLFCVNPDSQGFVSQITSFAGITWGLAHPDALLRFIGFNLLPLGLLACWSWRAAILAGGALLPNLLGFIGGAEKIGWSTHYHTPYFPILVFSAMVGVVAFWRRVQSIKWRLVAAGMIVTPALLVAFCNPYEGKPDLGQIHFMRTVWGMGWEHWRDGARSSIATRASWRNRLAELVPPGSSVSTIECGFPPLFRNRTIYYFPVGIDNCDFVVMAFMGRDEAGKVRMGGTISYQGQGERLDRAYLARMAELGFDIENPEVIGDTVLITRKRKTGGP